MKTASYMNAYELGQRSAIKGYYNNPFLDNGEGKDGYNDGFNDKEKEIAESQATHYLPKLNGAVQLYYRVTKGKYNTGEVYTNGLAYYSWDFHTWRGTNERNVEEFIKNKLIRIENRAFYNNDTKTIEYL